MNAGKYFTAKKQIAIVKNTNVVDLLKRSRLEEQKIKRKTFAITVAAVSALALSGYIIYQ